MYYKHKTTQYKDKDLIYNYLLFMIHLKDDATMVANTEMSFKE